jgi:hypothetical protein
VTVDAGHELADELRAVIDLAATGDHDEGALQRALDLLRAARSELDGPRRDRWYDVVDMHDADAVARSYAALSPFRGTDNALAPPMTLRTVDTADGPTAEGNVTLGRPYEGPPHGVHGGVLAGLFDDILGAAQRLSGTRGVTGRLTVRYRALTPIDTELVLRARPEKPSGRRVLCRATCHAGDTLTAEAEALFVAVDFERIAARS